jgi:hypothetical protein
MIEHNNQALVENL